MEKLELVQPDVIYMEDFLRNVNDYKENRETHYFDKYKDALEDFASFVSSLMDHSKGIDSPYGHIACSTLWLVNSDKQVLGVIRIRHEPLPIHGHVGYDIPPRYRNRGYATRMLELSLPVMRRMGLTHAIISCKKDNIWSEKVIRVNKGSLVNMITDQGEVYKKYVIQLCFLPMDKSRGIRADALGEPNGH